MVVKWGKKARCLCNLNCKRRYQKMKSICNCWYNQWQEKEKMHKSKKSHLNKSNCRVMGNSNDPKYISHVHMPYICNMQEVHKARPGKNGGSTLGVGNARSGADLLTAKGRGSASTRAYGT